MSNAFKQHTRAFMALFGDAAPPGRLAALCAYTASCWVLHGLLQHHYIDTCRSSWLSLFALDSGPYCALVRRGLSALQWSPLVATGIWIPRLPGLPGLPGQ
jgi:hypothetical protein